MGKISNFMKRHEGDLGLVVGALIGGVSMYIGTKIGDKYTEKCITLGLENFEGRGYLAFTNPHEGGNKISIEEAYKLLIDDGIIAK